MSSTNRFERTMVIILITLSITSGFLNLFRGISGRPFYYIAYAQGLETKGEVNLPVLEVTEIEQPSINKEIQNDSTEQIKQDLIDVNIATLEQLMTLPGIGPVIAQRILDLRDKRGGYVYLEELLDVPGIGKARFERIKPLIWLSPLPNKQSV